MKALALAIAFVVSGCSMTQTPTAETDSRLIKLQDQSEKIAMREQQCIKEAVSRSNDQIARIAGSDSLGGQEALQAYADEDREISECKEFAKRDQAELAASEREEYVNEAQQQRDRTSLMAILTASRPN
jgi:hypothetical protein